MPDNGRGIAWGQITVSSLLAAALGVVGSIIVFHYTTKNPELVYETFPPTDFASQTTQLSIYNARVENVGDKEAEDVQVRFELSLPTAIDEFQVEPSLRSIFFDILPSVQPNVREIRFARLNPGESSRFSILSNKGQHSPLQIEVRARGITGHAERDQTSRDWPIYLSALSAILTAAALGLMFKLSSDRFLNLFASQRRVLDQELRLVRTRGRPKGDQIRPIILNTKYRLFYNPAVPGLSKTKIMRFGPNGQILEGQNNNETTWRFHGGLLELLDSKGNVHSRFYYSADDKRFFHTNDPDTGAIQKHGIRDQYMIPEE
jgi:hypothetical protein